MQVCGVSRSEMQMRCKEGTESKSDTITVRNSTTIDYCVSKQQFRLSVKRIGTRANQIVLLIASQQSTGRQ